MALTNCTRCNKLFNRLKNPLCPTCIEKEEEEFNLVRDALHEKPNQTVEELAEETGVSEKAILRFLKDGRIASDAMSVDVKCGRCGGPAISLTTRLCEKCAAELAKQAAQASAKAAQKMAESATGSVHQSVQLKTSKKESS